ncbi:MAG: ABC transporter substrate-binding protein [Thaumarchaeota archaeon]|nr:ABC transporter substrate-binding protein [Nitrososphaerota archaeon]
MHTIKHGYYAPYFYWMFPLIVANEEAIFPKVGVDFKVTDIVAGGQPENKADWYLEAFQKGVRDFYFCCAWQGVYSTNTTRKGRIIAAAPSTLLKTFAIYTKPDSDVKSVYDLGKNRYAVAVNKFADAHYVTLKNMRQFLPDSQIQLAHLGGVEQCFRALLDGKVKAATLAGPYADFAQYIGMRRVLGLSRDEPTFIVMDETFDKETVSVFLKAVNMAIARIRENPERYRDRYYKEFEMVVKAFLQELAPNLKGFRERMEIPVWADLRQVTRQEFETIRNFMEETGLITGKTTYEELVNPESPILAK